MFPKFREGTFETEDFTKRKKIRIQNVKGIIITYWKFTKTLNLVHY